MSTALKQFHEEEGIGKTYDFQVARRLLRYLRPYLRLLVPALLLTFALNLLGILQPKFTQYAIDWHILPRKLSGLELLIGVYVTVQLLRLLFSYFQALLLNTVGQYVMFDMRRELYDKLQNQEVAYYDRNPVGRIMTRLTSDVDSLNELFTAGITDLLGDVVMIFAIIGAMLWMDVRLTFVTLLTVPMLWAATTWFRIGARKGYDMVRTRIARINAFLQEHFAGAQTVQIFNAETKSVTKFREINADYRKANIDTIFYYAVFFPLVDLIGAAGVALIIWYGGYRVMQNTPGHTVLTLGAFAIFRISTTCFRRQLSPRIESSRRSIFPLRSPHPLVRESPGAPKAALNLKTFGLLTKTKTGSSRTFLSRSIRDSRSRLSAIPDLVSPRSQIY